MTGVPEVAAVVGAGAEVSAAVVLVGTGVFGGGVSPQATRVAAINTSRTVLVTIFFKLFS
jgi:hypothetical protein